MLWNCLSGFYPALLKYLFAHIPLMSLKFGCMTQYFGKAIHLLSDEISPAPAKFPPPGLSQPLFLIPSLTFIPGDIALDFTVWKPNPRTEREMMKERESGIVLRERPTSKLTTGCEGVTLASSLTRFHSFFFRQFFYCSVHPLWREKLNILLHSGMLEWRAAQCANLRADWKLSKVTIPCKNYATYTFKTRT